MAQLSWPSPGYNDRAVNDAEYEVMSARFSDDGVDGAPTDTAVVSAGSGLTVNVREDAHASLRGHAWTSGPSTVTLAVGANSSGSTRVDRVVLRLDRSTWTVRAVVKPGTPGAGAPPLTQQTGDTGVYEILLAGVTLLDGAASVTVTRAEMYIGARIRPALSSHRNPNPVVGEMVYETDTGRVRVWTGSTWLAALDDSGVIDITTLTAAWESTAGSVLQKRNGNVHLRLGSFVRTGGTLAADTESRLPAIVPATYTHPNRDQYGLCYISGVNVGRIIVYSKNNAERAGQVWLVNKPTISSGSSVFPASGLSWVVD